MYGNEIIPLLEKHADNKKIADTNQRLIWAQQSMEIADLPIIHSLRVSCLFWIPNLVVWFWKM